MSTEQDIMELYPNILSINDIFYTICNFSVEPARRQLDTIIKDVEQMVGFESRKHIVNRFFDILTSGKIFSSNIEHNWREFYNERQQKQMDVF
jgi:hypothetical protein